MFPESLPRAADVVPVDDERWLQRNFPGWDLGEISAGRAPLLAVIEEGFPVSICFCARRSDTAAAAGLETAEAYRGRGFGPRATAAWALAVRASGRAPLYSAAWSNEPSLAVARKLALTAHASFWSVSD
jgi:predicted GNAT family acetyltransferase